MAIATKGPAIAAGGLGYFLVKFARALAAEIFSFHGVRL